jgi:hypothetical protein
VHVGEQREQLVLLDAVEAHAVARAQQEQVVAEDRVPAAEVVHGQRPPEQLVSAGRLDRVDRVARPAEAHRALGRPRP